MPAVGEKLLGTGRDLAFQKFAADNCDARASRSSPDILLLRLICAEH